MGGYNKLFYIKEIYLVNSPTDNLSKGIDKFLFISKLLIGSFFYLIIINLFGLIPYVFTFRVLPHFTLSISIFINIAIFNTKNTIIHIVPKSRPNSLIVALVLIEFIRLVIRPLTLILRLMANLIAGHLIIEIIGRGLV